jgi:hypothetical protein
VKYLSKERVTTPLQGRLVALPTSIKVVVPGKPFLLSITFASKVGAYLSEVSI